MQMMRSERRGSANLGSPVGRTTAAALTPHGRLTESPHVSRSTVSSFAQGSKLRAQGRGLPGTDISSLTTHDPEPDTQNPIPRTHMIEHVFD